MAHVTGARPKAVYVVSRGEFSCVELSRFARQAIMVS